MILIYSSVEAFQHDIPGSWLMGLLGATRLFVPAFSACPLGDLCPNIVAIPETCMQQWEESAPVTTKIWVEMTIQFVVNSLLTHWRAVISYVRHSRPIFRSIKGNFDGPEMRGGGVLGTSRTMVVIITDGCLQKCLIQRSPSPRSLSHWWHHPLLVKVVSLYWSGSTISVYIYIYIYIYIACCLLKIFYNI